MHKEKNIRFDSGHSAMKANDEQYCLENINKRIFRIEKI